MRCYFLPIISFLRQQFFIHFFNKETRQKNRENPEAKQAGKARNRKVQAYQTCGNKKQKVKCSKAHSYLKEPVLFRDWLALRRASTGHEVFMIQTANTDGWQNSQRAKSLLQSATSGQDCLTEKQSFPGIVNLHLLSLIITVQ